MAELVDASRCRSIERRTPPTADRGEAIGQILSRFESWSRHEDQESMTKQRFTMKRTFSGPFCDFPYWEVFDQEHDPLPDGEPIAAFKRAADANRFVAMKRALEKP